MKNVNKPSTSIRNWSSDDQPREKMIHGGPEALSNSELLAILINTGSRGMTAVDIAKNVLKLGNDNLNELGKLNLKDIQKIKGIGQAKAITIAASLELGRRRQIGETFNKTMISSSRDIAVFLRTKLKDYSCEVFAILLLNRANRLNHFEIISKGGLTGTVADPRIILKKALEQQATGIILCHNHPSGSLKPSRADEELTKKIKQAAAYLDITITDHIIVSEEGYFSFADEGML
ncbi:MAG: DNA repair protein RadC [Ferruginibacter sp.]